MNYEMIIIIVLVTLLIVTVVFMLGVLAGVQLSHPRDIR